MRDDAPELGRLDGLGAGNVQTATESQEIDVVDSDGLAMGQEPPERAICSRAGMATWFMHRP
jgi:hypothetical protein